MTYQQALGAIRPRFAELLEPAKKKGQYICPLCGHGKGGDGLALVPKSKGGDGCRLHCFGCGFHGDIIDLYGREHGLSWRESFQALCGLFSFQVDREPSPRQPEKPPPAPETGSASFLQQAQSRLSDPAALAYLQSRGVSLETAARCGCGFDPAWVSPTALLNLQAQGKAWAPPPSPRLILPTSEGGYTARAVQADTEPRFRKMKEGPAGLFCPGALYDPAGRPVFIVEGEFDALSIQEAGALAVALGSVGNQGKLLELIKAKKPTGPLILSLDNDEAGQEAAGKLSKALEGLSVPFVVLDVSGGHKDPSEALQAERGAFLQAVGAAARQAGAQPDSVGFYLSRLMGGELRAFQAGAYRRTGFDCLDDEAGGIYPGLYVLGAISSLGKTTFLHQAADQMAAMGEHVLYFSLEQSRLELVTKSLARLTAIRDMGSAVSSLAIRRGCTGDNVRAAARLYREQAGDRLSIIEGNFDCTVDCICQYTARYIERNGVKPVVMVDYLQILQGGAAQRLGAKELVDCNVTELKRLSRAYDVPVFVVSSVNRANYLTPIDFESFKESGGIEYTADVVWGLQLEVLQADVFSKEGRLKEKRDLVRKAKAAEPRRVELVCLKNRYGVSSYRVPFEYFPRFDLFREGGLPERAEPPKRW